MVCLQMLFFTFLLVINIKMAVQQCNHLGNDPSSACVYTPVSVINQNGIEVNETNCGTQFSKEEWQEQPTIVFSTANKTATYTILLVDPDPPNYPKGQYYLHWLVANAFGDDLRTGNLSKANIPLGYMGPAPPANSGQHRYMFLIFMNSIVNQKLTAPQERTNFELLKWLQSQDEDLCGPDAGIQFLAQF